MKNFFCFGVVLLALLGARLACADTASDFEAARQKVAAANPPGILLTLRLSVGRTQFHRGEIIPLTAAFADSLPNAYRLESDPGSRDLFWNSDSFHVDPDSGVVDPLRVYYDHEFGQTYDGPGPLYQNLGTKPLAVSYTLNEWLRFEAPGRYRVYLTSSRLSDAGKRNRDFLAIPVRVAASNAVDLEILPDDPAWSAQVLQKALTHYDENVQTLRFLGTPETAQAMVDHYGALTEFDSWNSAAYFQTRLGLFGFPQRALIIQDMVQKIAAPDFPVSPFFLADLAQVRYFAAFPQSLPPFDFRSPAQEKARKALLRQRMEALNALNDPDRKTLAATVSGKSGRARAISLYTLFSTTTAHPVTAERQKLAQKLVSVFDLLPPEEQTYLLEGDDWPAMRRPTMLAPLRRLYAHSRTNEGYDVVSMRSLALRRLTELSPAEGRALLLTEIKSAHPRVDEPMLCSLPDRILPKLDAVLVHNLKIRLQDEEGDTQSRLVERYASRALLPRVKAIYRGKNAASDCAIQSNLLAYFLRTDRAYGLRQLRKALATRQETGCYRSVLSDVSALYYSPEIERLAAAHLNDTETEVAADAAKTLGTYGSAAAEAPLWARLQRWHRQWAGKAEEIEPANSYPSPVAWQLEFALTQALATTPGWLANRAKLQALENLCVTRGAKSNVASFLQNWDQPVPIIFLGQADHWQVVQYCSDLSFAALKSKLIQFPPGTVFRLLPVNFSSPAQQFQVLGTLKPFLEKHRMRLERGRDSSRPYWPRAAT